MKILLLCSQKIYKSRNILLEILKDRGYSVDDYTDFSVTEVQAMYNNKELDMNNLFGEASGLMNDGMMENMMGMFGNMMGQNGGGGGMPDLGSMMNMMSSMQPPMPNQTSAPSRQSQSKQSGNHDPNVVKERLRKKLDSKK